MQKMSSFEYQKWVSICKLQTFITMRVSDAHTLINISGIRSGLDVRKL